MRHVDIAPEVPFRVAIRCAPRTLLPVVFAAAFCGCLGGLPSEPDGLQLSADTRADYEVFAVRCSKCHSLARPLDSRIDDDQYWKTQVDRMRRQPGSGISADDSRAVLRFLHAYVAGQRRKRG
jgi:hypothetical protein